MSLVNKITVNAHYTRSINLERDASSSKVVGAYIPTTRAQNTLSRIAETFSERQAPRAWTLIGPYGSGKSSFAIFLSHLLSSQDEMASKAALKVLRKANPSIARRYQNIIKGSAGHCCVLLTGSPESLAKRLVEALADAAEAFWSKKRGRNPVVINELRDLSKDEDIATSKILEAVKKLQDAIAKTGGNGLLIIIDELGKFLEYEARHYGANDVYLLQALAEHACAGHDANLTLIALLHQSFEQYAKGLGEQLKNEWAKVQGRFENIPFLESTEQVLRIVSAAFTQNITDAEKRKISAFAQKAAEVLDKSDALPGGLDKVSAKNLFAQCYPLNPVSALLLPILCQKVAQNERTLFSYLGSQEPFGFRDSISKLKNIGDWIQPWEIYDYFIMNQPAAISDHFTHRRWAEVVTAIERLGDAPESEIQLLKTIGLLNIIGTQGGFKASKDVISLCLPTKKETSLILEALNKKSIIQYRKFSGEYRVWQGSDFDLDAAVNEQLSKLGKFDLAEILNARHSMLPIVARRYTIKSGALRYFVPVFTDAQTFKSLDHRDVNARIIFFLAEGKEDEKLFATEVKAYFSELDIVVEYLNAIELREIVSETLALEYVQREAQELHSDPVVQREFKDRYAAAVLSEHEILERLINEPSDSNWYWKQEKLNAKDKRTLQQALSSVLERVYHSSPVIHNELINRDKPSSQAAAGRNKLLLALLTSPDKEDLGIEKFPPEKAIYRSVVQELGLHQKSKSGKWKLTPPAKKSTAYEAWKIIENFLSTTEKSPRSFADLTPILKAPPYGIKEGVLPVFYVVAFLVNQQELALYENGTYSPYFTEEQLERFVKVPHEFTVQRFRIEGLRASIYEQYTKALFRDNQKRTIIELVRPLAKFIGDLPEYTQKTKSLDISQRAKAVRNAFNLAKSPEKLLFEDLPKALGYTHIADAKNNELEGFSSELMDALKELKECYPNLLETQKVLLAQALHVTNKTDLSVIRKEICGKYVGLENYTVDIDGLRAFIKRLTKTTGSDEDWFVNILMFLGKKPVEKWSDADKVEAEVRLAEYSRRLLDLRKLQLHYEQKIAEKDDEFEVILLKTLKKGREPIDEVVTIDKSKINAIKGIKEEIQAILSQYKDKELQLSIVAQLADEFLTKYRSEQQTSRKGRPGRPRKVSNET